MASNDDDNKYSEHGRKDRDLEDFFSDDDFELGRDSEEETLDESGYRSRRVKDKSRRKRAIISTITILVILVVVAAAIVFGYRFIRNRFFTPEEPVEAEGITIPEDLALNQDINIILAGAREDLLEPQMNSIIFSSFNSTDNRLTSLCMPVKILMDIPGFSLESVDRAVDYGGMDLLSLTLENGLGIEVDHYLLMDIINVVDSLGGITVPLDSRITLSLDDGSEVTLEGGPNDMDGITAVNYLEMFSGAESEVTTNDVKKQKAVFTALFTKINGADPEELASNLSKISGYIETDLNLEDLSRTLSTFARIESANDMVYGLDVSSVELEGETYYVPDISRISEIFSDQEVAAAEEESFNTVTVNILNGAGTPGLAGRATDLVDTLTHESGQKKFNVAEVGNADNFDYEVTEIIVSSTEGFVMNAAEELMGFLGAGSITTQEGYSQSQIVVILGSDFNPDAVSVAAQPEETEEEEEEAAEAAGLIQINILNGEGTTGLASTVEEILVEKINDPSPVMEVIETKNADSWDYTQTKIIVFTSREGVSELAQDIQQQLGVGAIESSDDNVDNVDITIILGSDYTNQ
ncbi:MAG: LCP family protein [Actinomycetota bacterium]